jgi:hypothetical protein
MAKNLGQIYENTSFKYLKEMNLVTGKPAGGLSNIPDLTIKLGKGRETAGLELKTEPTAAGGLVMKYINGTWELGSTDGKEEKELLASLAKKYGVLKIANNRRSAWGKNVPYLQYDPKNINKKIYVSKMTSRQAYDKDMKQYGGKSEIHITIDTRTVSTYYNSKECYYMNIGSHGLYLLGNSDPLDLNGRLKSLGSQPIPIFNFPLFIRCRCQAKGGGDYNFNMVQTMKAGTKSPYNFLPMNDAGTINIREVNLKANQELLKAFRM